MKKKTAVLLDGQFVNMKLTKDPDPVKQAVRLLKVAHIALAKDEELFRIYYYDCEPFKGKKPDPFGNVVDFEASPQFAWQNKLLAYIKNQQHTAVRLGEISYKGWKLNPYLHRKLSKSGAAHTFTAADFKPDFQQKGVDMRIGLDVATLAMGRLVDRIVMVTADSDFIPAMKLARREGVQVALCMLGNASKPNFAGHADLYRTPSLKGI